jgi:hypothetical protein
VRTAVCDHCSPHGAGAPDVQRRYDEVVVKLISQVRAQRGLVPSTAYSCFGVPGWATCGGVPMCRLCCCTTPPPSV